MPKVSYIFTLNLILYNFNGFEFTDIEDEDDDHDNNNAILHNLGNSSFDWSLISA